MNTALTIIGLAMFIFIIVFSLKRAKEKKQAQQEEHQKIKEYGESINKETRNNLQKRLNANVHYPNPISENPMYKSILNRKDNCLNSQLICDTILTLPIHPYLTNDEVDKTCTSIMMTV